MPDENQPAPTNQTAVGNENIQVAGSGNVIQRITNFIQGDTEQQRAQRNRHAMLQSVKNTWVEGVLEKSLYHELIQLGMEERPGVVELPGDRTVQMPDQPSRILPPGTRMVDVFDKLGGSLLILGEPGSGKTTMLLELARDAIAHAEQDPTQPIPVVFNLSSWSDPKQSMADWLVNEFITKYSISRKVATAWLENDELLLLLDGLDEVDVSRRDECVEAINDHCREYGPTPLVISSRIADYEALNSRLMLRGAVNLHSLTYQQVDNYLNMAGLTFAALRTAWQGDAALQELAQTPLMLSIMMLAYQDQPLEALSGDQSESIEARRKRVFDVYVQRMFERVARANKDLYPKEQTLRWLTWLARKMTKHSQTIFLVERLDRGWLETRSQRICHWILVGLSEGLVFALVFGEVSLLIIGFLLTAYREKEPSEVLRLSWRIVRISLVEGLIFGLITALVTGPASGLIWGLFVMGLGLYTGVERAPMENQMIPNEGIRRSLNNAIRLGLVSALIGALGYELGLVLGLVDKPRVWLGLGLYLGLIGGLIFGGSDVVRHCILRLILYLNGSMPLDYVGFLDYAAERIFLRKVGGGYIFVHRLLQEYFAAMNSATPSVNK